VLKLRYAPVWAGIAWIGVALALILSLWPGGAPLPFRLWDKLEHALGYFILTLWFMGLYPRARYPQLALGAFLLGIGIELLQAFTPTRAMELGDAAANALGIGLAWLIAWAGLGGWAARVERRLAPAEASSA
jgi:VanZ family protein